MKNSMNNISLIVPFFGKLPDYFKIFVKSLEHNPDIDVLLFTDQEYISPIKNLIVYPMTFEELRKEFQAKFDFKIALDAPYKLCDYRPAFGYLFADYIKEYKFWGHVDIDLVLGNFRKFVTDELLKDNDKIYQHGHLCLYRNTEENNNVYKLDGGIDYRKVFSSNIGFVFDEIPGIQQICNKHKVATYRGWEFIDVSPWKYHMTRVTSHVPENKLKDFDYLSTCYFWEDGEIYRAYLKDGVIEYDTFLYLHFQKRNLKCADIGDYNCRSFFITNDGFIAKKPGMNLAVEDLDRYNISDIKKEKEYIRKKKKFQLKRRIRKYLFRKG
ncbi:DUF6625 family protein [Hungatella sp.]|uniref:DUF6625 family protein n=1 Tax=Hungatella sp. TaxID=2613924 RepID=UPI002A8265C4|nr:DUF6625 family protein [Hungatella sp.]